jgi:hypothetical protein
MPAIRGRDPGCTMMTAMTPLHHELRYDQATVEQVRGMLADPAFREDVCASQHYDRYSVDIDRSGDLMTVNIDQVRPTAGVPSFAKKFVGSEVHVVQHEEWTSVGEAALEITIPGKPGDMRGSIRLAGAGGGVTETVHVDIRVSLPLVGGRIEGLIADLLTQALEAENRVGREWLAR